MSRNPTLCFCGHAKTLHNDEGCTYCKCGVDDYYVRDLEAILRTIRDHCKECLQTQRPVNLEGILALITDVVDPERYGTEEWGVG